MESIRKCLNGAGVTKKSQNCEITIFAVYLVLSFLLMLAVALYSYAAESRGPGQTVEIAVRIDPCLKSADAQFQSADLGNIRPETTSR
jgi:hypothetical protein